MLSRFLLGLALPSSALPGGLAARMACPKADCVRLLGRLEAVCRPRKELARSLLSEGFLCLGESGVRVFDESLRLCSLVELEASDLSVFLLYLEAHVVDVSVDELSRSRVVSVFLRRVVHSSWVIDADVVESLLLGRRGVLAQNLDDLASLLVVQMVEVDLVVDFEDPPNLPARVVDALSSEDLWVFCQDIEDAVRGFSFRLEIGRGGGDGCSQCRVPPMLTVLRPILKFGEVAGGWSSVLPPLAALSP